MKELVNRKTLFDVINVMEVCMHRNEEFFNSSYCHRRICEAVDAFAVNINSDLKDEETERFLDAYFNYISHNYDISKLSVMECGDLLRNNEKFTPTELIIILTWLKQEYDNMMTIPSVTAYVIHYNSLKKGDSLTIGYPYKNGFKKCINEDSNEEVIPYRDVIETIEFPRNLMFMIFNNFFKF